ncbi:MAG: hypothetical protein WDW38_008384 [Sanguina aurantia]
MRTALSTPVCALAGHVQAARSRVPPGPPTIYGTDGHLHKHVLPHCSKLLAPYHPTFWASNRHMQTTLGLLRGIFCHGTYRRQHLISDDGGTLGLDWFNQCERASFAHPSTPVLLVMHGINGGSHEGYCKWVCATAEARGWRSVVLNYRGCNGLPLTSPRGYNATVTPDIYVAVTSVKGRFPGAPLLAVGFSLGGVILAKYLAEADMGLHGAFPASPHTSSGFAAAAIVSSPICLSKSNLALSLPWRLTFVYNLALAYKIQEYIRTHRTAISQNTNLDVASVLQKWTVTDIEELGTNRTFGYQTRSSYYDDANSLSYLPHIKTPTLVLTSQDDPFLGVLPDQECVANPHTLLAVTEKGGHVAFLQPRINRRG